MSIDPLRDSGNRDSGPLVSNNKHSVMPAANNDDYNWALAAQWTSIAGRAVRSSLEQVIKKSGAADGPSSVVSHNHTDRDTLYKP